MSHQKQEPLFNSDALVVLRILTARVWVTSGRHTVNAHHVLTFDEALPNLVSQQRRAVLAVAHRVRVDKWRRLFQRDAFSSHNTRNRTHLE